MGFWCMLTSRRWMKKNTNIDPDKIIYWEHPNFVSNIKFHLDNIFSLKQNFPKDYIGILIIVFIYMPKKLIYDKVATINLFRNYTNNG